MSTEFAKTAGKRVPGKSTLDRKKALVTPGSEEGSGDQQQVRRGPSRGSEYKKQLVEKQKLKQTYGMAEKQFKRFFRLAQVDKSGTTGDNLLTLLELRLDNVIYRLKMALSRKHARQMIVHGHFTVNGKKVKSPSLFVKRGDVVALSPISQGKQEFLDFGVNKRLNIGIKVPDWLELNKADLSGSVVRKPTRADISTRAEMHYIVEMYSK